jgi:aspartate aminotransferase
LLAGAKPVFVDAPAPTYVPDIGAIRGAVAPRTKAIIINSPNNPTGAVYDRSTLQAIGDLAITYDFWIITDECYSSFVFTRDRHESIVTAHPGTRARTILVNAFSKELAITGWRLGYLAASPEIVAAAKTLQSHTTSNANVIAQHAILHHLEADDGTFENEMYRRLAGARQIGLGILSHLREVSPPRADGTFFFYLDLAPLLGKLPAGGPVRTVDDVATLLLEKSGVASVPGTTFGDPAGLRLSFGALPEEIEPALRRVVDTLNGLAMRQAGA